MAESAGILLLNAEDNSVSGLTITEEGSNNLTIAAGAALHGSLGYNFSYDGTNNLLYFQRAFTAGADIYMRFYFYIPSAFSSNTSYLTLGGLYYNNALGVACYVRCYYTGGNFTLDRLYYTHNGGSAYVILSGTITRDTLHYLELRYKSGAGDGEVECWLDGTSKGSATSLTNNTYQASYALIGNVAAGIPTTDADLFFDDIKVDSSYIGAYADETTGGGLLVGASALVGGGVLCGQGNLIN